MPDARAEVVEAAWMHVTVVYAATARDVRAVELELGVPATVANALAAPALAAICKTADRSTLTISIWGRRATASCALVAGDRIELCRPLLVDPKTARRERFAQQGPRGTGLFADERRTGVATKAPGAVQR